MRTKADKLRNFATHWTTCAARIGMLIVMLLPIWGGGTAWADEVETRSHYMAFQSGTDQIRIEMPVYDEEGYDGWVDKGYVYVTAKGSARETVLYYNSKESSSTNPTVWLSKSVDGTMILKRDEGMSDVTITSTEKGCEIPKVSGKQYCKLYLIWTIPDYLRGKELTISWDVYKTGNMTEWSAHFQVYSSTITLPSVPELLKPELTEAILGYDAAHAGQFMLIYTMGTNNIERMTAHFDVVNGHRSTHQTMPVDPKMSGYIYLDASKCYKDFYLDAIYTDVEKKRRMTRSEKQTLPVLHSPTEFTAVLQPDGSVTLTWSVKNAKWEDIMSNDSWEIQRNTSGALNAQAQWQTINNILFKSGETFYTCKDENFVENYKGHPVYYRLRRSSTVAWDWGSGSYAQAELAFPIGLSAVHTASVTQGKWTADSHPVSFSFGFGTPERDSQGRYLLRNEEDWERLAQLVQNGTEPIDIIMTADVDLSGVMTMMGEAPNRKEQYFRGTFDGNGHTLTVDFCDMDEEFAGPFNRTENATIKNLHVKGRVLSKRQFCGGLVGLTSGETLIENCRVSTTVSCTREGDVSSGGIVGRAEDIITIKNTVFDGQMTGRSSSNLGGFIGVVSSIGSQNIRNCLFAPSALDTKIEGCRTFVRDYNQSASVKDSYYTMPYDGVSTTSIDGKTFYVLRSTDDWEAIRKLVKGDGEDLNIVLDGSFYVNSMLGSISEPYHGIFDGNGHTLSVDITSEEQYASLFQLVRGETTIRNLNVQGRVSGGAHASGLVGGSGDSGILTIENCCVSTYVITSDYFAGGFLGDGLSSQNRIRNCLFDGIIEATNFNNDSWAGALIGWENGSRNSVVNCLENGTYVNFNHTGMCYHAGAAYGNYENSKNNYSFHDWGEALKASGMDAASLVKNLGDAWQTWNNLVIPKTSDSDKNIVGQGVDASDMTIEELKNALGEQWKTSGNSLLPVSTISTSPEHVSTVWDNKAKVVLYTDKSIDGEVIYTERSELTPDEVKEGRFNRTLFTSCVDHDFRLIAEQGTSKLGVSNATACVVQKAEAGEAARYHFDNNVQVTKLEADTLQTSVSLEWTTTGVGDFFRILRYDKMENRTDTLEHSYSMTAYVDKNPQPQHAYVYTVEGVNQCEGEHVSSASVTAGCCPTGMVRGYVRMADGTAMAGVTVKASPSSGKYEGGGTRSAVTDEAGFFEIDSLVYQGAATYRIYVELGGDMVGMEPLSASFDDHSNLVTNLNFVQRSYRIFSGQVIYEGTSIPVVGAQFERDDAIVKNGSGQPIVTDSQGNFSLSIPEGDHIVRVVKDGHVFAEDGYYIDPDAAGDNKRKHNWSRDVADHIFWDRTRVTLRGRVVGGDLQGDKPLGQSASKNNLGDSLTIVMQLEGDNASYLVRDQLNGNITELHYRQAVGLVDTCEVNMYRHRMVIHPADLTGEYLVKLPPVKFKVTEVYAEGYPTLFQAGQVGQTIDLTGLKDGEIATWNRIYHVAPTLDVRQFNLLGQKFMGIEKYKDLDNTGKEYTIELWSEKNGYSFGHPVFMAGSPIMLTMAAIEKYYYNNDSRKAEPDVVHLSGGSVKVQNGLVSSTETKEIPLDSLGEALYKFTPQNLTFTEENDMALKTLTMTLVYDSTFYDVKPMNGEPIRGYVMAEKAKSQGRRVVDDGGTFLIDILRDPPGAGSSAYIEKGSKMTYSFTQNLKAEAGLKLTFGNTYGGMNLFQGIWAGVGGGSFIGDNMSVKSKDLLGFGLVTTYYNSWQYGYTFETTERISTSSSSTNVGRDADVFIGMTQNAILEDGIAVRAVNDYTYKLLTTHAGGTFNLDGVDYAVKQGTMKLLAEGKDSKGNKVYLIRDEVLAVKTELSSTFVHSQTYIEKELIPNLLKIRNNLLLPIGTSEETAKALANKNEFAAYISKVPVDDDAFGIEGSYIKIDPDKGSRKDSIADLNDKVRTWVEFLAINEKEKLEARDLVKRYDLDGRSSVTYSESFGTSDVESRYWQLPYIGNGLGSLSFPGVGPIGGGSSTPANNPIAGDGGHHREYTVDLHSNGFYLKILPVVSLDYNWNFGKNESLSKKAGFTLSLSAKSNMVVDVYRASLDRDLLTERVDSMKLNGYLNAEDYFFQYVTEDFVNYAKEGDGLGLLGAIPLLTYVDEEPTQYRSFVYRTRGGATVAPYEDERKSKYYMPGTVLDEKTVEIDRLRIWTDQQSMSNVPYDEPARFTVYMANESEVPEQASPAFTYFLDDASNANGAKVVVDGAPVAGEGHTVVINPGTPVTKQVEIWPGAEFDYENIGISIYDPNDKKRKQTVYLSAHFVPVASKVDISLPGNKWVINTESQFDTKRQQYYMPVRIDGFNMNSRGFDHIELQYKLTTQGDKEWVNVCAYYKDSLYFKKSSGVSEMIPEDGKIMAKFYGEIDPVEQSYDLRAVCYCRHGDGFLTRSSEILTGIKDTRRPQLFGTPKPEDGILDIGEDIILRFSEPIAGNYLRPLNNFQVVGQTNSNNITLSTSLRFNGGYEFAQPLGYRNLAGKAFTVDVMLNPDDDNKPMTVFSHGNNTHQMELGLTADRKLSALFIVKNSSGSRLTETGDEKKTISQFNYVSKESVPFNGFRSVRYVLIPDMEKRVTTIVFYDGTKEIGRCTHPMMYDGYGDYYLGMGRLDGTWNTQSYRGEMLEFRLWNHAMTVEEMNDYSMKHLTGYELGLLDNYPLSEGKGIYSFNRCSGGSDLCISGPTWKMPVGIGMKLDGNKGFRLKGDKFTRWNHQDYSLMFWFRTTDTDGTILANGRSEDEIEAKQHFNFFVENGNLGLRLGGMNVKTANTVNNGYWHHVALTVSHSRNVGCLYLDERLCNTFTVDTIGGIQGGYLAAGATYLNEKTAEKCLSGNIDEIAMFEMAVPENFIKEFSNITPTGEEMGLRAYLNFSHNVSQINGSQRLMPTGVSLKRYKDEATGELTNERDTIVAQEVVEQLADRSVYAPMQDTRKMENIRYSFVADGKDLLINLDVPDERIEKTNVYVMVKDVADLNGNTMASPAVMNLFVYRNPLRWDVKRLQLNTQFGEEYTFVATIKNLSGKSRRFTLSGLPIWMKASETSGSVAALDEKTIFFTISPYINIGNFDETISLVGDDGMNEPLPLTIIVRGETPDWAGASDQLKQTNITMNVVAKVTIDGVIMNDPDDRLAVFGDNHELLGITAMNADDTQIGSSGLAYLTIYNSNREATKLHYEYFDASTGIIHRLYSDDDIMYFKADTIVGTVENPVSLDASIDIVQTLHLKKGWNWISFNIWPDMVSVEELMNNATKWEIGDGLEIINPDGSYAQLFYKSVYNAKDPKNPIRIWDNHADTLLLDPTIMYRLYSNSDKVAYFAGFKASGFLDVKPGWNRIGYISSINLPLGTALASYTDMASKGDIIKSQNEFAMLTEDSQGNKAWKGTLTYMRAGEGYMLKNNSTKTISLEYPSYTGETRYNESNAKKQAPAFHNASGTSMTVVALAEGVDVEPGDVLTAWRGAELCGKAVADDEGVFYLNVGDADVATTNLNFTIERNDEVVASAGGMQMRYVPNAALGTPDEPTAIRFVDSDALNGDGWYTLDGVKLPKKPTIFGVYIYNNKKMIIK